MEKELIKDFSNLRDFGFEYIAKRNIAMMRLTDEDWERLTNIMTKTYGDGITREDLNEVFNSANINQVRGWLGKPMLEDEVYPKFYSITSKIKHNRMIVAIPDEMVDEEVLMDEDFNGCAPQYLGLEEPDGEYEDVTVVGLDEFRYDEEMMWNKYNIPTYAVYKICEEVAAMNGKDDFYDVPDTFALNERNRYLELDKEEIKNIDKFISKLKKLMPEGFDIDWDDESCGSPFFHPCPEFGLGMDCVVLRVYPKNTDRLKGNICITQKYGRHE